MIDVADSDALPVDARVIEAELARLWRQAAEASAGGLVRTSSLTVLVMLMDEHVAGRFEAILAEVPAAHPCRAVLVALTERQARALLSAHCRPPRGGQPPVCWEEIRLEGSQAELNRIMSAASALVVPGLPVQVWWPGDPDLDTQLFQRVVAIGDRIVVDSAQFAQPLTSLARYAQHAQEEHGTVAFSDLTWRRLESWRPLVAEFFDAAADRTYLNGIETVTLRWAGTADAAGGLAEPLLLLGWLASRLGWSVAAGQSTLPGLQQIAFDDGARTVCVDIGRGPGRTDARPGLTSIELRASHEGRAARFLVRRVGGRGLSLSEIEGVRREAQVHLGAPADAELLNRELAGYGRDRIFEDALQIVRALQTTTGGPPAGRAQGLP